MLLMHFHICISALQISWQRVNVLMTQVSGELIRVAILWHEMWHEALEEASRQYFGDRNVDAMLATLMPLHQQMMDENKGPTTLKEITFMQV